MCKHETKTCPRCHSAFECRVGDITRCQCYTVKLDDAERDFLAHQYNDCLCANCITEVKAALHQAQQQVQIKQAFEPR